MAELKLIIGNKNYSSWSMRPWVLLAQADIPFTEVQLKFSDDGKVVGIDQLSPTGQVPVLWIDDQPVWDSLAICEAAPALYPQKVLGPTDKGARGIAPSIQPEMHSGFRELRARMPMN